MATIADLVGSYIKLRDRKKELDTAHKQRVTDLDNLMGQIEARLRQHFTETGAESVRTEEGTAYSSIKTSVRVVDSDVFRAFIETQQAWAMLDARANKTAVEAYLEEKGELPPGLDVSRIQTVNIRRS